jgi:hypothetical protein
MSSEALGRYGGCKLVIMIHESQVDQANNYNSNMSSIGHIFQHCHSSKMVALHALRSDLTFHNALVDRQGEYAIIDRVSTRA